MDISVIQNKLRTYNDSKKNFLNNVERLKNEQTKCVTQIDMYENSLNASKEELLKAFINAGITINNINDVNEIEEAMSSVLQKINSLTNEIYSCNNEIDNLLRQ